MSKKLSRAERKEMRSRFAHRPPTAAKNLSPEVARPAPTNAKADATTAPATKNAATSRLRRSGPKNDVKAKPIATKTEDDRAPVSADKPSKKKPHAIFVFGALVTIAALLAYFATRKP